MTQSELYNPADLLANTAAAILAADSPTAFPFPVYKPRDFSQQNINRVEVAATGFARASDHMDLANVSGAQVPFYNHHRGQLAFTVITSRNDQQSTDNHAYALGRIGYLCSRPAQKFTPAACSGLSILDIEDEGISPQEDESTDTDRTTRTFTVEFIIPAAVYAAAT